MNDYPTFYMAKEACRLTKSTRDANSECDFNKQRSAKQKYILESINKRISGGYSSWYAENKERAIEPQDNEIYFHIFKLLANNGYTVRCKMRKDNPEFIDYVLFNWGEADEKPGAFIMEIP